MQEHQPVDLRPAPRPGRGALACALGLALSWPVAFLAGRLADGTGWVFLAVLLALGTVVVVLLGRLTPRSPRAAGLSLLGLLVGLGALLVVLINALSSLRDF